MSLSFFVSVGTGWRVREDSPVLAGKGIVLGLSSDTKPTAAAGLLFVETDTGKLFNVVGGVWSLVTAPAAASISQTEIDFGTVGVSEASFLITDAAVSASSKLIGTVAYVAPTGKDLDELDMDQLDLKFAPGSGQFTLYATVLGESHVADKFKINYQVGA